MIENLFHKIIVYITLLVTAFTTNGQPSTPEGVACVMNKIKLSEEFVYGEAFNENESVAMNNALADLLFTINQTLLQTTQTSQNEDINKLGIKDIKNVTQCLQYKKSGKYTVMAYLPKTSISQLWNLPQVEISEIPTTEQDNDKIDYSEIKVSRDIIEELCIPAKWESLKTIIMRLLEDGSITSYGFSENQEEVPTDAIRILVTSTYDIIAILSPKYMANCIDYKTGKKCDTFNYPYRVIAWIK